WGFGSFRSKTRFLDQARQKQQPQRCKAIMSLAAMGGTEPAAIARDVMSFDVDALDGPGVIAGDANKDMMALHLCGC
ncbi:hypothetical protein ACC713_36985, partial [Rhizobium johnstonii]